MTDFIGVNLMMSEPKSLASGEAVVVNAKGFVDLCVIAGTGATVTVSRVDSFKATAHTTGSENSYTVAANTRTVTEVDWPYYRISVAGGSARFALV